MFNEFWKQNNEPVVYCGQNYLKHGQKLMKIRDTKYQFIFNTIIHKFDLKFENLCANTDTVKIKCVNKVLNKNTNKCSNKLL